MEKRAVSREEGRWSREEGGARRPLEAVQVQEH